MSDRKELFGANLFKWKTSKYGLKTDKKQSTFIWKILLTNLFSVIRFVSEIPGRDVTRVEIKTSTWGKSDLLTSLLR